MKAFSSFYRRYGVKYLINPFTYLISLGLIVFPAFYFFLTQKFFAETGSTDLRMFFAGIPYASILAIPALVSIIGFQKNEFSFPGKSIQIILAKNLSTVTVLAFATLMTVMVPIIVNQFGDIQLSQVLTGYFVILLYFFALVSICIFISICIKNTGISFLVSAVILAVFNSSHLVSVYFSLPDFLTWFFKQVSFAWHFDAAGKGILDTRDIVFFVAVCSFFVGLSVIRFEKERGQKSLLIRKITMLSFLTLGLLLVDSQRIYKRIDVTKGRQFSITEFSKRVLEDLNAPLDITYYLSPELKDLYPQVRDVRDFLDQYAAESSYVSFKTVDASDKDVQNNLYNNGIYGQQMDTTGRGTSVSYVYSAITVTYVDHMEIIPFLLNTYSLEFDLTSRIQSMVQGTMRLVQVVTGNGLDLDEDYTYVKPWLESKGFTVLHTYLPSEADADMERYSFTELRSVPVLLLGSSYVSYSDSRELDAFIQDGGKIFIATQPYTVDFAGTWDVRPNADNVTYLLQKYGIYFKDSLTADVSNFQLTMYSDQTSSGGSTTAKTEHVNYSLWPVLRPQSYALYGMTTFWPCALTYDEEAAGSESVSIKPVLFTSRLSWQIEQVDGKFYTNPFTVPSAPENYDNCASEVVALECTLGNNGGQIFLYSDQYAFTRLMFNYTSSTTGDTRNLDFMTDELIALNGQEEILPLKNRNYADNSLYKKTSEELSSSRTLVFILVVLIPLLVLGLIFAFVYFKRRMVNEKVQ